MEKFKCDESTQKGFSLIEFHIFNFSNNWTDSLQSVFSLQISGNIETNFEIQKFVELFEILFLFHQK